MKSRGEIVDRNMVLVSYLFEIYIWLFAHIVESKFSWKIDNCGKMVIVDYNDNIVSTDNNPSDLYFFIFISL
jgi:hypothetical protein